MDDPDLSHLLDERRAVGIDRPPIDEIVRRHDRLRRRRRQRAGAAAAGLAVVGLAVGVGLDLPRTAPRPTAGAAAPVVPLRRLASRAAAPVSKSLGATSAKSRQFAAASGAPALCNGATACGSGADLVYHRGTVIPLPVPRLDGVRLRAMLYPVIPAKAYLLPAIGWAPPAGSPACEIGEDLVVTLFAPGPHGVVLGGLTAPAGATSSSPIDVVATGVFGAGADRVEVVVVRSSGQVGELSATWRLSGSTVTRRAAPTSGWTVLAFRSLRTARVVQVIATAASGRALGQAVVPAVGSLSGVSVPCGPAG